MSDMSQFAHEWIHAWNGHDLEEIMSHYAEEIDFVSPVIQQMGIDPEGRIRSKPALNAYFEKALAKYPDLKFEFYHELRGPGSTVLYYKSINNTLSAEYMEFNASGLVTKVRAHYKPLQDMHTFVSSWLEAWSDTEKPGAAARVANFYRDDCRYKDPGNPATIMGKVALENYLTSLLALNKGWKWTLRELIPIDGGCVVRWQAKIPVQQEIVSLEGMDLLQMEEGKIKYNEVYFDRTTWLKALKKI
ncbi:hypothetical protein COR50_02830 [Chitinophaga caeni]|uniref:SnoaL-like domain-containing protein n=1 Tax=Chitinophaga caeni TaxID=2029983 RepID=A0A291QQH7_9BACT|nr:nuclear transport factor 2 family protein [Chitinophaga caeni]ATL46187.1 hypothetical protein COR50_02830 [Chitinophaga caeni]